MLTAIQDTTGNRILAILDSIMIRRLVFRESSLLSYADYKIGNKGHYSWGVKFANSLITTTMYCLSA